MAKRVSEFKKNFLIPFSDVEDYATFTIDFGDCIGIVEESWSTLNSGENPTGPVIYVTKGTIVSDRYDENIKIYKELKPYQPDVKPSDVIQVESIEDCISLNVLNFIKHKKPLFEMVTADFNMKAMAAFDAGSRSCETGNIENIKEPF